MAILFSDNSYRSDKIFAALQKALPDTDLRRYPDIGNAADIRYVLIWYPAAGSLENLPNLQAIFTTSAGVDGIIGDKTLPLDVPIIRNIDPALARGVAEHVTYHALKFYRGFHIFEQQKHDAVWKQLPQPVPYNTTIGIMGMGEIGKACADMLRSFGFLLRCWSNSPKDIDGVTSFAGDDELHRFLSGTDILVNTLPLTHKTHHILNSGFFAQMKHGAFLINVGRGKHLVENDLLSALESGQISAAALDVFDIEPLPSDHPFWRNPNIVITPHIASITNMQTIVDNMMRLIADYEKGIPFPYVVDREKQY